MWFLAHYFKSMCVINLHCRLAKPMLAQHIHSNLIWHLYILWLQYCFILFFEFMLWCFPLKAPLQGETDNRLPLQKFLSVLSHKLNSFRWILYHHPLICKYILFFPSFQNICMVLRGKAHIIFCFSLLLLLCVFLRLTQKTVATMLLQVRSVVLFMGPQSAAAVAFAPFLQQVSKGRWSRLSSEARWG